MTHISILRCLSKNNKDWLVHLILLFTCTFLTKLLSLFIILAQLWLPYLSISMFECVSCMKTYQLAYSMAHNLLLSNAAYIHPRAIASVFEPTKALIMALKKSECECCCYLHHLFSTLNMFVCERRAHFKISTYNGDQKNWDNFFAVHFWDGWQAFCNSVWCCVCDFVA